MTFILRSELHCHSNDTGIKNKFAPFLYDSTQMVVEIINKCLSSNIKILAITDHDSLSGYRIAKEYIKKNNINILLVPGCEISTTEGHILAYGMVKEIKPKLNAQETIDLIHNQGGIAVVAHPFFFNSTGNKLYDLKPDAIEGLNSAASIKSNNKAIFASRKMNIPYIAASDSHEIEAIGNGCTIFPENTITIKDVLENIKSGNFSTEYKRTSYLAMTKSHFFHFLSNLFVRKI